MEIKLRHLQQQSKLFATEEEDKIVLSIIDTGVGVKRKNQDKLFQLFGKL